MNVTNNTVKTAIVMFKTASSPRAFLVLNNSDLSPEKASCKSSFDCCSNTFATIKIDNIKTSQSLQSICVPHLTPKLYHGLAYLGRYLSYLKIIQRVFKFAQNHLQNRHLSAQN